MGMTKSLFVCEWICGFEASFVIFDQFLLCLQQQLSNFPNHSVIFY